MKNGKDISIMRLINDRKARIVAMCPLRPLPCRQHLLFFRLTFYLGLVSLRLLLSRAHIRTLHTHVTIATVL